MNYDELHATRERYKRALMFATHHYLHLMWISASQLELDEAIARMQELAQAANAVLREMKRPGRAFEIDYGTAIRMEMV